MENLETKIDDIIARNERVEADKAWETSKTRKILILIITYIIAYAVMYGIGVSAPHLNALIPTMGFYLSTLSIGFGKNLWIKHFYK